jgi:hypothetical protein
MRGTEIRNGAKVSRETDKMSMKQIDAIHHWFELTYAQYLTIPRSVLEAMPDEWQTQMVELLTQLDDTFQWRPHQGRYWVELRDANGKFVSDRLKEYRYPDGEYIESIKKT